MKAQQLLDDLARNMGLPALPLDTNHCARLNFNGGLSVNFESDEISGHLHLYSELGELPLRGREAIYRELLSGNVFGLKTGGAALSLDSLSDTVLLCQTVMPGQYGLSEFAAFLENFVGCAEHWQKFLAEGVATTSAAAPAEDFHDTGYRMGGSSYMQV